MDWVGWPNRDSDVSRRYQTPRPMQTTPRSRWPLPAGGPEEPGGPPVVVIVGASARAAAWSARRAGFAVWACDRFGDADLKSACQRYAAWRPGQLVGGVEELFAGSSSQGRARPLAVLAVGGIERQPHDWDALTQWLRQKDLPAVQPRPDCLRVTADPAWLDQVAQAAGIVFPAWHPAGTGSPSDGDWLWKPQRRCGGFEILRKSDAIAPLVPGYWQQNTAGQAWGLSFVAGADGIRLLGAARGLTRRRSATPFAYAGSTGPLWLDRTALAMAMRLGSLVAQRLQLRGLFGVDLLCDAGRWSLLEVNPRYCASMELHDTASSSCVGWHLAAVTGQPVAAALLRTPGPATIRMVACKRVWYAEEAFEWTDRLAKEIAGLVPVSPGASSRFEVVDRPHAGDRFAAGDPVLTIITAAPRAVAAARLARRWCRSAARVVAALRGGAD